MTPLHVASSQGSLSVAKCLIEAGADLRSLDEEQMTPLHFACMEGSLEVAQLLFETGVLTLTYLSLVELEKHVTGSSRWLNAHLDCKALN